MVIREDQENLVVDSEHPGDSSGPRLRAPRDGERPLFMREADRLCRMVDGRARWHVADEARQHTAPPRPPRGRRRGILAVAGSLSFARLSGQLCLFYKWFVFLMMGNH